MAPATFAKLEQAALHIIRLVSDTPGLENTRLAVIGDLAVCKYLKQYERPMSIEFIVSKSSSPSRVRKEIVGHPMTPLVEKSQRVFYKHSSGFEIEVKFTPDWLCPYLPTSAQCVRNLKTLPYISIEDLIVFKADACSLRDSTAGKQREAHDAAALLELAAEHCRLQLDEDKLDRVEQALEDVVEFSAPQQDKTWWQKRLGMAIDKRRSVQEIFSEIAELPPSPTSPGASSVRSSIYSTMSRSSSSSTFGSGYTSSSSMASMPVQKESSEESPRARKMSVTGKGAKHRRKSSIVTGATGHHESLDVALQHLQLDRCASPGIALTNRI
ncbi:hypothetical protein F5Y15DRAFT_257887 [Xylariaceae sp. FL0016]|nr:hypothetical protein F5Y15DRAFT_257887 [Xylariaceae sp. FL0016]